MGGRARTRGRKTLDEFTRLPHPVVYTPGDNEWTDTFEEYIVPSWKLG